MRKLRLVDLPVFCFFFIFINDFITNIHHFYHVVPNYYYYFYLLLLLLLIITIINSYKIARPISLLRFGLQETIIAISLISHRPSDELIRCGGVNHLHF